MMKRYMKTLLCAAALMLGLLVSPRLNVEAAGLTQYFNTAAYADAYPDLKAAFGYDADKLLAHYFDHGIDEGRTMPGTLNVKNYRAMYPDLNAAFGNNWRAYAEHYDRYGRAEGRNNGVGAAGATASMSIRQKEEAPASVLTKNGMVPDAYMAKVEGWWLRVPEWARQDFASQSWKVSVSAGEIRMAGYNARIQAYTSFADKTIYIGGRHAESVVHEAAHYMDWRKGMCHNAIPDETYAAEKAAAMKLGGGSASNYGNKQEYLAECFWLYVKDTASFKKACPLTATFIEANLL